MQTQSPHVRERVWSFICARTLRCDTASGKFAGGRNACRRHQGAASAAQSSPMNGYVDTLMRSDNPSAQGQQNPCDTRGEMVRLFTASFQAASMMPSMGWL